ncbi:hypothetical protein BDZ89DRAFT_1044544 [Hymenopellis radicata]|nr:hypothetical protein BDZ89DRAFT_1044544 [Hymenopellis radicata]
MLVAPELLLGLLQPLICVLLLCGLASRRPLRPGYILRGDLCDAKPPSGQQVADDDDDSLRGPYNTGRALNPAAEQAERAEKAGLPRTRREYERATRRNSGIDNAADTHNGPTLHLHPPSSIGPALLPSVSPVLLPLVPEIDATTEFRGTSLTCHHVLFKTTRMTNNDFKFKRRHPKHVLLLGTGALESYLASMQHRILAHRNSVKDIGGEDAAGELQNIKFHDKIKNDWSDPAWRIIGCIQGSPAVTIGPKGFTKDWGSLNLSRDVFMSKMYLRVDAVPSTFTYPDNHLLPLSGIILEAVYNYDKESGVFSKGGDSGLVIVDGLGRIDGILTAGAGITDEMDITYATLM